MSNLLILGAGGHGKVVADAAILTGEWNNIAFLDNNKDLINVLGIPVIGSLETYQDYTNQFTAAFVAIGNNKTRMYWLDILEEAGFNIPVIIHPSSILSRFSQIEKGSTILAGVVVNANASIGRGCILNTSSTIDHDCIVEHGVHISPGVNVSGTVKIRSFSWIGVGAKISNNITIGANVIVAAGATVIRDIPDNVMVAGVPAEIKKTIGVEK